MASAGRPHIAEVLASASAAKVAGNVHFKDGSFAEALRAYKSAYFILASLSNCTAAMAAMRPGGEVMSAAQQTEYSSMTTLILTNCAASYLKVEQPDKALQYAQRALINDPSCAKARLRLGQAHTLLGNFAAAKSEFTTALSSATGNASLQDALRQELERLAGGAPS